MARSNLAPLSGILVVGLMALAVPSAAWAQRGPAGLAPAPQRAVSIMAGGFSYDFGGDETSPMAAARVDWRIARHLLTEIGVSYSRVAVDIVDYTEPEPTTREADSNLLAVTAGVQAELPLPYARPYIGIAAGLFGRFDPEGGDRFLRPTLAFPAGVRVPVTPRVGARGEVRVRFDEHQSGGSSTDAEMMLGLSWAF